jgi:predicted NAD/FAD-binding protein
MDRSPHIRPKVAVVGGGVAGIGAAHRLLGRGFDVDLFETEGRLGGDVLGVDVKGPDGRVHRVDAGVSDFNRNTFVRFREFIDELGLEAHPIAQDASYRLPDGEPIMCMKDGKAIFAKASAEDEAIVSEMNRFRLTVCEVMDDARYAAHTAGSYLSERGYSERFCREFFYPRAIGCFPTPSASLEEHPIGSLVSFWRMHGIVGEVAGDRACVKGGMHCYVDRFEQVFAERGGRLRCGTRVVGLLRTETGVRLRAEERRGPVMDYFDQVVIATNPNEVLGLLDDASTEENTIFHAFPAQRARVVVHTDRRLMPRDPAMWGAYNYTIPVGGRPRVFPTITFWPNRLARLPDDVPEVFVTVNPAIEPDPATVVADKVFVHPVANDAAAQASRRLARIQGRNRTWICGSYVSDPFLHESAFVSGLDAADGLIASSCA